MLLANVFASLKVEAANIYESIWDYL